MHIAVLSDSHDNIWKLEAALPHLRRAEAVVHCGDLCSPFMLRRLAEGLKDTPIHMVWGNNDGDVLLMSRIAREHPQITLHGVFAQIPVEDALVGVHHYPEVARPLALSGQYRMVFYGHNHQSAEERLGDCLLLNPGEMMGMKGGSTLAIVDSRALAVEWVEV